MYSLRYYQTNASKAARETDNGILVLPTGAGKSLVIADIVNNTEGHVIVFQPNKEILEQNFTKLKDYGFEGATIFSASLNTKELGKVTFATIGSVMNKLELFEHFEVVIIDECHLVNAKGGQYLDFIDYVKPKKVIGLTATPYRLHSNSFGSQIKILTRTRPKVFKDLIHVTQTKELIDAGYLLNPEFVTNQAAADKRTMLRLNSTGANYTDDSVKRYLQAIDSVDEAHKSIYDAMQAGKKHILVFTESVSDSDALIALIEKDNKGIIEGKTTIATVNALTKKKDREKLLEGFKSGEIQVMVNVGVLTTGFDFPELDCIIVGRPTMSLSLWYQMVGRVVRPYPNKKPVVYDICGNYQYFGNPLDLELRKTNDKLWDVYNGTRQLTTRPLEESNLAQEEKMTFGKFAGQRMSDVPTSYLQWGVENINSEAIKQKLQTELSKRLD